MSPREKARPQPLREAQDRTIRALMSLVDDLTVEVDEAGCSPRRSSTWCGRSV